MSLNSQQINEAKALFGDVFEVTIGKVDYAFRALTVQEYYKFLDIDESSADIEEIVVMNAVIWPNEFDINKMRAGDVTALSNRILEFSGFSSLEIVNEYLAQAREEVKTAIPLMQAFIMSVMPTYNKEVLDTYTLKQITSLVATAEYIIDIQSSIARGESLTLGLTATDEPEQAPQPARQRVSHKDVNPDDLEMVYQDPDKPSRVGTAVANDPIAQKLHAALNNG